MSEPSVSSNAVHQLRVVLCGVSWCGGDYLWSAKPVSLNSVKSFRMPSVGAANICTASLYVARPMGFRIWATSAFREDARWVFVPRLLADAPGQPSIEALARPRLYARRRERPRRQTV